MFSKTTRNLVQKVRNKSSNVNSNSSSSNHSDDHHEDHSYYSNSINANITSDHANKLVNKSFLCHQYSADDINNYLSVHPNKGILSLFFNN